jgi:hypothetical protein
MVIIKKQTIQIKKKANYLRRESHISAKEVEIDYWS